MSKKNNRRGAISPNLPKKTYAFSRFSAKILPVSISLKFFEIYISNYFVCVMNDVISRIEFLKYTLINFYLIAFGEILSETPYKIKKIVWHMT